MPISKKTKLNKSGGQAIEKQIVTALLILQNTFENKVKV